MDKKVYEWLLRHGFNEADARDIAQRGYHFDGKAHDGFQWHFSKPGTIISLFIPDEEAK